jgi:hypothetical protein
MATEANLLTASIKAGTALIPKLKDNGSNWVSYQTRMQTYLNGVPGFRRHLMGRAKPPTPLKEEDKADQKKLEVEMDLC